MTKEQKNYLNKKLWVQPLTRLSATLPHRGRGRGRGEHSTSFGFFKAFTLAEVLITLGIIGIVAALTIPTLIANTQSAKFRSQFKKTLSTLNQAVKMNVAQYEFDFAGATDSCQTLQEMQTDNPATKKSICAIMNGNLNGARASNYSVGFKDDDSYDYPVPKSTSTNGTGWFEVPGDYNLPDYVQYELADGSLVFLRTTPCDDSGSAGTRGGEVLVATKKPGESWIDASNHWSIAIFTGFIDVNGRTLPNKEVSCKEGKTKYLWDSDYKDCTVDNKTMGDVFPIVYHDSVVEPATNAGRYVLNTTK